MNVFFKVIGFIGVPTALLLGFMISGGNPVALIHISELVIVIGMTCAAMLCTFGIRYFDYLGEGVASFFTEVDPNPLYAKISAAGSKYAIVAGVLAINCRRHQYYGGRF